MDTATQSNASHALVNVAQRLSAFARLCPNQPAVIQPAGRRGWRSVSFRELEADAKRLSAGLRAIGVTPGTRLALLVRPGVDLVALVFALLRSGAVAILIDPGMGRRNLVRCLAETEPEGFVAVSAAQAVRALFRRQFPKSRFHVTVGRRWFWGGITLEELRRLGDSRSGDVPTPTLADDPAAIIFTTGSTGPPKGVLYRHGNFDRQVGEIRDAYGIEPGGVNLAAFPLFGLFSAAMGVTTVFPRMDFARPARVDPENIVAAIKHHGVTQSFGSPALWNVVGRYCHQQKLRLDSLRQVFSAGAPVSGRVLAAMKGVIHPDGEVHTPYGATEALPIATNSASIVLGETQALTDEGGGVCVGQKFPGIQWQVIRIVDGPLATLADAEPLGVGQVGELIVSGPVVTREYVTRTEANALAKIIDGERFWHRMGDVGRLDERGRFWFYGRKAHRVETAAGTLYTIACEAIYNRHPRVHRTALLGIGPAPRQRPVIVVEPLPGEMPRSAAGRRTLVEEVRRLGAGRAGTSEIRDFLLRASLPVDIRHNAKIFREKLAPWAARRLG